MIKNDLVTTVYCYACLFILLFIAWTLVRKLAMLSFIKKTITAIIVFLNFWIISNAGSFFYKIKAVVVFEPRNCINSLKLNLAYRQTIWQVCEFNSHTGGR